MGSDKLCPFLSDLTSLVEKKITSKPRWHCCYYWIRTVFEFIHSFSHSFICNLNVPLGTWKVLFIFMPKTVCSESSPILLTGFQRLFKKWFSYSKNSEVFLVVAMNQYLFLLPCCHCQLIQSKINHTSIRLHIHPSILPFIHSSVHSFIHSINIY